ncbi:MAG: PilZ domain-containing protein [Sphingomonas fennica]
MDEQTEASARREPRDSLFMSAMIGPVGGTPVAARVRNLSGGGVQVECTPSFATGDPVELELRGVGRVRGHIAWSAPGGKYGIAFAERIDPSLARRPLKDTQQPMLVKASTSVYRPRLR